MAFVTKSRGSFSIKAYIGDNKTLLAFNFATAADSKNLAGFTIACKPPGLTSYFLWNELQFPVPSKHAQVAGEKPNSSRTRETTSSRKGNPRFVHAFRSRFKSYMNRP